MVGMDMLSFDFSHPTAFLLAFVPGLVTLTFLIWFSIRTPPSPVSRVYQLFVLSVLAWQLNDAAARISTSAAMAESWDRILSLVWLMNIPSGIHWTLLFMGRKKLVTQGHMLTALYLPPLLFSVLYQNKIYSQHFANTPFWGWVKTFPSVHSDDIYVVLWFMAGVSTTLLLLGSFAWQNRHSSEQRLRSFFPAIAYSISVVPGMVTQGLFPLVFHLAPIPIVATLMLSLFVSVFALDAFKVFILAELVETEWMVDLMEDVILIISKDCSIHYLNASGAASFRISRPQGKLITLTDLFPDEDNRKAIEQQIVRPSFSRGERHRQAFSFVNQTGNITHWDIATYPISRDKEIDSLLVVARDITDRIRMSETRLDALRARMNHHFIFNSLNSVQYYIHNNEREKAEVFLTTFATLIRRILNHSGRLSISLAEEISTLELYLIIEQHRFGAQISYEFIIDRSIDTEHSLIPSMLMQPYVENAILHGLATKKEGGRISIRLSRNGAYISCIIEDNGIGRAKAMEIKQKRTGESSSEGMSITKARLDMLNQIWHRPVSVWVTDLEDAQHQPCGTRVEIRLPLDDEF